MSAVSVRHDLAGMSRRAALTFAVVLGLLTSVCLVFVILMQDAHREVGRSAALSSANLASSLAHDVERNVELLDQALQAVTQRWLDSRIQSLPPDLRDMILFNQAANASGFGAMLVLDQTGTVRASSQPEFAKASIGGNRDYFLVQVPNSNVGLFVSRPFLSQFSKEWMIALSRRISGPDGSFAGVVVGTLKLSYLDSLYDRVDLGSDGAAALLRLDGTIVAHVPAKEGEARRNIHVSDEAFQAIRIPKFGSLEGASPIDGKERILAFHRVGTLPLIQDVEISARDAYAAWWRKAWVLGGVLGALCAGSLTLLVLLNKELIRRTRAEAELTRLASTDPLTGLSNRRRFDEGLASEWGRAVRSGTDLALLMIDADYFKLYNDKLGHPAGDEVLKSIAECIRSSVHRPSDLPCRIGGEEFAVLLPETDANGCHVVAELIRRSVEALGTPHPGSPLSLLTISVGAVSLRPRRHQASEELIAAADAALYRAKDQGRNRSHLGDPPKPLKLIA